ncbi:MAG TPA: polysaccharide deacetylase family protein [Fluviicola sp.]|nr:polysaccharide deacetylase family protein [Fluviicola sp.]
MKLVKPPRIADWFFQKCTWRFDVSEPTIFLTFDDGPNPEITPFVLDLLDEFHWKATFFCVGENCLKSPEIYQTILERNHTIGNHTMNHAHAHRVKKKEDLEHYLAFEQIQKTTLFRPPYGRLKPRITNEISKTHRIIMWSWLSYDYDLSVPSTEILNQLKRVKPGDILVFHDNAKIAERQKELLPKVFAYLKQQGFTSKAIE